MRTARIVRNPSTDQGTFGQLFFGTTSCYTTELPWRDNLRQKSCIPTGAYSCALVHSPRMGLVYGVRDVPGRSSVLIHTANFGGNADDGWATELQGCIAPCLKLGIMRNGAGRMQAAGLLSRPAVRALMDWADKQPFTLEIS